MRGETTAKALYERGRIAEGTRLMFKLREGHGSEIPFAVRPQVHQWLGKDEARRYARWQGDPRKPLQWEVDGQSYSLTSLVREIVKQATGVDPKSVNGPEYWWSEDGRRRITEIGAPGR